MVERSVGKKSLRKAEVRKAVGRLHAKHSSVLRCTQMNYRNRDTNTNTHKHANEYTCTYCICKNRYEKPGDSALQYNALDIQYEEANWES